MLHNKKGAALLQVLLVAAVLAGLATMLLRVSLSRTSAARHTYRTISAQLLISRCQAEVNALWSAKTEAAFARDLDKCAMYCSSPGHNGTCADANYVYEYTCTCDSSECTQIVDGQEVHYTVKAKIERPNYEGQCKMTYSVTDDISNLVEVVL